MKPIALTDDEIKVVTNPDAGDLIILEIVKGMSINEMKTFDVYTPTYRKHYDDIQISWLNTEKHLLQNRGEKRIISEDELIEDFEKCHNGLRFRVFYVLKFPSMVKRIKLNP